MTREELDRFWLVLVTIWMFAVTVHNWITVNNAEMLHDRIVRLEKLIRERPEQIHLPELDRSPKQ